MKRPRSILAAILFVASQLSAQDPAPQTVEQSPAQLQQLVAPIALYPDSLIAQILSAATYPDEIVDANRWMQERGGVTGQDLATQVDQQVWDPSVKALTQFPSVLANMSKNLAWTSELGDAYLNQQDGVMQAIQQMRQSAKQAGNLNSTSQQTVKAEGSTIVIEPAEPNVVYVPQYDPWFVYGYPLAPFPGWYSYPGLYFAGPGIGWGLGFNVGFFAGFGWGFNHWGYNGGRVLFNRGPYISNSTTIIRRNGFDGRGFDNRGFDRGRGFDRNVPRGGFHASPSTGMHSSTFSGFNRGGEARMNGFRGGASFGGGGARGGGGGGRR